MVRIIGIKKTAIPKITNVTLQAPSQTLLHYLKSVLERIDAGLGTFNWLRATVQIAHKV